MTRKPKNVHAKCNTKKCPNYYNTTYKSSNGYCKPCNKKTEDLPWDKNDETLLINILGKENENNKK